MRLLIAFVHLIDELLHKFLIFLICEALLKKRSYKFGLDKARTYQDILNVRLGTAESFQEEFGGALSLQALLHFALALGYNSISV